MQFKTRRVYVGYIEIEDADLLAGETPLEAASRLFQTYKIPEDFILKESDIFED